MAVSRVLVGTINFSETQSNTITDLTGTTWLLNSSYTLNEANNINATINFNSNNTQFTYFWFENNDIDESIYIQYANDNDTVLAYDSAGLVLSNHWSDQAYRTITFTGGTGATNSTLIAWLQANATLQSDQPSGELLSQIFSGTNQAQKLFVGTNEVEKIYLGTMLVYSKGEEPQPVAEPYLTFSSPSAFTINVVDNTKYWDGTLEYSTNATNWSTWGGTSAISSSSSGDTKYLYLRGSNNTIITSSSASSSVAKWVLTGSNISCDGNIENLLDYQTVANGNHPAMATYCYNAMFYGNTSLISTPNLPAINLTDSCYRNMFRECSNLTTIMQTLPATTLANNCYRFMFQDCTSLTETCDLPATVLAEYCYYRMFRNCTSLKYVKSFDIITTAQFCCDGMFRNCTSLQIVPLKFTLTNLIGKQCFAYMFQDCTSLTYTPLILNNIVTSNYSSIFSYMFYGCSSLNKITKFKSPIGTLYLTGFVRMFYNCNLIDANGTIVTNGETSGKTNYRLPESGTMKISNLNDCFTKENYNFYKMFDTDTYTLTKDSLGNNIDCYVTFPLRANNLELLDLVDPNGKIRFTIQQSSANSSPITVATYTNGDYGMTWKEYIDTYSPANLSYTQNIIYYNGHLIQNVQSNDLIIPYNSYGYIVSGGSDL